MLKELTLLKWQEKATQLAYDDATSHVAQLQENASRLQENLTDERLLFTAQYTTLYTRKVC